MGLWRVASAGLVTGGGGPPPSDNKIKIVDFDHYQGLYWDTALSATHPTNMGSYTPTDDYSGSMILNSMAGVSDIHCNLLLDQFVWHVQLPSLALIQSNRVVMDIEILNPTDCWAGCAGSGPGYGEAPNGGTEHGLWVSMLGFPSPTDYGNAFITGMWYPNPNHPGYASPEISAGASYYGSVPFTWEIFLDQGAEGWDTARQQFGSPTSFMATGSLDRWFVVEFTSNSRQADINFILHGLTWGY